MSFVLTEQFLAKAAGWEAMKEARGLVAAGKVLSAEYSPPLLRGVVQAGTSSYKAGLVLKNEVNIENICTCRQSREWGTICAHSVAVGLYHLGIGKVAPAPAPTKPSSPSTLAPADKTAPLRAAPPRKRLLLDPAGKPMELAFIFPPNFLSALEKGRVMLVIEGVLAGKRMALNSIPLTDFYQVTEQDQRIIEFFEALAPGEIPSMVQLDRTQLENLLPLLGGHPSITLGRGQTFSVLQEDLKLGIRAELEPKGEIVLQFNSVRQGPGQPLLLGKSLWFYNENAFAKSAPERSGPALAQLALPAELRPILQGKMRISRVEVPRFVSQVLPLLQRDHLLESNFAETDFQMEFLDPVIHLELRGGLAMLDASLMAEYRGMKVPPGQPGSFFWMPDPENPKRYYGRNLEKEQGAIDRLKKAGFASAPDGVLKLQGQEKILPFFARVFPRLEKEWKVSLEERLEKSCEKNLERIQPKFEITPSGVQWFDFAVTYEGSSGERFTPADIQRLLMSGSGYAKTRSGKFALVDTGAVEELQEVLLDCSPEQRGNGRYILSRSQAAYLQGTIEQQQGWRVSAPPTWQKQMSEMRGDVGMSTPPLGDLETVLRPYQKHGVAWMNFLRQNYFGGILADEMGLGKTVQTLAFLRSVVIPQARLRPQEDELKRGTCPALIVCPTSLVFNWVAEAKKFAPTLRVLSVTGASRTTKLSQLTEADLVITSYGLLRRDLDFYQQVRFDTVVLDEAQHIKNRQTQNAQAVKAVPADHRLVLTGTPLENSVLDLWSIYDFLMPGYLGSAQDFKERYEVPISKHRDSTAQGRLARRIKPFLLRRTKAQVAPELPPKIEQVSFCEMTAAQAELYHQLLQATRSQVLQLTGEENQGKSRMLVFQALLRLRQVCCDPRLLGVAEGEQENSDTAAAPRSAKPGSGKVELFSELLQEVVDGGHRVLVFSQFVTMLKLLEEQLKQEEIAYCYLDGSTTDRGKVVGKFQSDSNIPVFLISLKAGGVGLNLSGADTVIHFDPWWNPAVEAQATDRAHRMGQTRVVTSYKLITRGTVEEKILELQKRKRALTAGIVEGEEQFAQSLSWEEIQELLA